MKDEPSWPEGLQGDAEIVGAEQGVAAKCVALLHLRIFILLELYLNKMETDAL